MRARASSISGGPSHRRDDAQDLRPDGPAAAPGIRLRCRNRIPHSRGLGSSSAAICAGIVAARALAAAPYAAQPRLRPDGSAFSYEGNPAEPAGFTDDDAFALATEIEGHPDNVAPCLAGGLTIAWMEQPGVPRMVKLVPHADVRPVALVPRHRLSTEVARGLLPERVPHADASANAGRAALLIAALTGRPERELLLAATQDRLHQDYRAPPCRRRPSWSSACAERAFRRSSPGRVPRFLRFRQRIRRI
nr:hypothetical protein GCM10020093_097280 [Planobispora longispora]